MKRRQSRKGSVLLSVVCFTTVLTILATTALSMSHVANKTSNKNVRSTQAEITAENYLQQYLMTFTGTGNDKYKDLQTLAASGTETSPQVVNVSMTTASGTAVNSQGDCSIYVYKKGSSVYVKSVATYAGEEEQALAVFSSSSGTPWKSVNALEAVGKIDTNGVSAPVNGTMIIESSDPTAVTHLKNDAQYQTHLYIENNVYIDSKLYMEAVNNKNDSTNNFRQAPTITCLGYLSLYNEPEFNVTDGAPKTDIKGTRGVSGVELSNKDGYINVDKKIIMYPKENKMGTSSTPMDIYCRGAYIGGVPNQKNIDGTYFFQDTDTIIKAFTEQDSSGNITVWNGWLGGYHSLGTQNGKFSMYGNFYSMKSAGSGTNQNGDLVLVNGQPMVVNGSLFVDGDVYIIDNASIEVTGDCRITGKIYFGYDRTKYAVINSDGTISCFKDDGTGNFVSDTDTGNGSTYKKCTDKIKVTGTSSVKSNSVATSKERDVVPALDYDPYTFGTRQSLKVLYADTTPNDMYQETDQKEVKYIKKKYDAALNTDILSMSYDRVDTNTGLATTVNSAVTDYPKISVDTSDLTKGYKSIDEVYNYFVNGGRKLTINGSCKIPENVWKTQNVQITVNVTDSDVVVLIPAKGSDSYKQSDGNWTTNTSFEGKIRVNTTAVTGKHFCYFMLYDPTASEDYYSRTVDSSSSYPIIAFNNGSVVYGDQLTDNPSDIPGTSNFGKYNKLKDTTTGTNATTDNRIMFLMPNNSAMILGSNDVKVQGTFYGPQADLQYNHNGSMLYGQAKLRNFTKTFDGKAMTIEDIFPAESSILDYITFKHPTNEKFELNYFTNKVS